jgi:hypothetical protein
MTRLQTEDLMIQKLTIEDVVYWSMMTLIAAGLFVSCYV